MHLHEGGRRGSEPQPRRPPGRRADLPRAVLAASLLALVALVVGACGTRLPDAAFAPPTSTAGAVGDVTGSGASPGTGSGGTSVAGTGSSAAASDPATAGRPTTGAPTGASSAGGGGTGPNQASDVGITATTIRLGTIVAEQGVLGDAFAPPVWGMRAWVASINAQGGIGGRTVQLFTCDDREDRSRSLACAKRLVEQDKVFALVGVNSRAIGGAAQYLEDQAIPVMGIPITNSFNRFTHFFSAYGSSYPRDGKQVGYGGKLQYSSGDYRFFKDTMGAKRAALFGYDIAESSQALDLFEKGLILEGYSVQKYLVSFAAPSFDTAVVEMQRAGTQLIVDAMDGGANAHLCETMARHQFRPLAKLTQIPSFGAAGGAQLNDTCRPITYITGGSRPYTATSVPFIAAFQKAMARYQPGKPLHQWELEAWVMADQARQALVSMGPAPTRKGFEAFLMRPAGVDVPGVITSPTTWTYDPAGATATTASSCSAIARWDDKSPGGWVSVGGFPYCVSGIHVYTSPVDEDGT